MALAVVARHRDVTRGRRIVMEGAIAALDLKLAATLLKTIELHTWQQLGAFAAILALRRSTTVCVHRSATLWRGSRSSRSGRELEGDFSWQTNGRTRERLRDHARALALRGVHVVVSNSAPPMVEGLYADRSVFDVQRVRANQPGTHC